MAYQALYRKWRPSTFEEVRGQDHIVTALSNQVRMDRIGHAYLFCGTRGTGKTSVAKIFAKAVNCEHPVNGSPCNECPSCRAVNEQRSINVVEIDAASNNGVDNIREIREEVAYRPSEGRYRVYIIDEVHMLSIGAFNALLKTLEEPPSYVIFILATTEAHKIPVTILSRCQRYDFRRITSRTIADRLHELTEAENITVQSQALDYIARTADGSMRDALSLLDQCVAFYVGQSLTYDKVLDVLGAVDTSVFERLLESVAAGDTISVLKLVEEVNMQGRDMTQFAADMTWFLRNLMILKGSDAASELVEASEEQLARMRETADLFDLETLMRYIRIFSELTGQMRYATQKRVVLEVALIKLCRPAMETGLEDILDRIRVLEKAAAGGMFAAAPAQAMSAAPAAQARPKALAKPVSEDIRMIIDRWQEICGDMSISMSSMLKGADLAEGKEGHLLIRLPDAMRHDYFAKNEKNMRELTTVIAQRTDLDVTVDLETADGTGPADADFIDPRQVFSGFDQFEEE